MNVVSSSSAAAAVTTPASTTTIGSAAAHHHDHHPYRHDRQRYLVVAQRWNNEAAALLCTGNNNVRPAMELLSRALSTLKEQFAPSSTTTTTTVTAAAPAADRKQQEQQQRLHAISSSMVDYLVTASHLEDNDESTKASSWPEQLPFDCQRTNERSSDFETDLDDDDDDDDDDSMEGVTVELKEDIDGWSDWFPCHSSKDDMICAVPQIHSIGLPMSIATSGRSSTVQAEECLLPIFGRALLFTCPTTTACCYSGQQQQQQHQDDENLLVLLSAVVLYNIGLVAHHRGILHGDSACLYSALRSYQMSLRIMSWGTTARTTPTGAAGAAAARQHQHHHAHCQAAAVRARAQQRQQVVHFVALVVLYNTAQIYGHLVDAKRLRESLCKFRQTFVRIHDDALDRAGDDVTFLFANVMLYFTAELEVAPAA